MSCRDITERPFIVAQLPSREHLVSHTTSECHGFILLHQMGDLWGERILRSESCLRCGNVTIYHSFEQEITLSAKLDIDFWASVAFTNSFYDRSGVIWFD